ncbi:hypothetical protein CWE09_02445 [Aliidiomarina minuta]|uniref:Photosynthesis system II assembly factor Ycf48/Hcf136-like domain-containing protein n=1 Tax=Aliidiomarina minuta TaxID=880057 RepID=A0A432W6B6_9GAMM|nr:YCF48-related protein [Aliidiomarina minuta]RUO25610.1 hypothetical protein CWE09_02445 [Aliidiomarina minuta]
MRMIALLVALVAGVSLQTVAATNESENNQYDVIYEPSPQVPNAQQAVFTNIASYLDHSIAVGAFGTILIREGGGDWQQVEVPTSVLLTSISYADANHIWVSGHDGVILRSQDAGASWQRIMDGYELLEMEYPWLQEREQELQQAIENAEDEDEAYEYEYLLDELSFMIQAAEIQFDVGPTKPFLDVHFIDVETGFALGAYGTLLRTTDAGNSWEILNDRLENPRGFHLNKMIHNDQGDLFIIGEAGLLFRSQDQGSNWDLLDSPYHGSLFGGLFDQQGRLWVYGLRGNVFISEDDGESFTSVEASTRYNINSGTVMADGTIVLAGHSGTLLFIDPQDLSVQRFEHISNTVLAGIMQDRGNELALVGRAGLLQFLYPAVPNR